MAETHPPPTRDGCWLGRSRFGSVSYQICLHNLRNRRIISISTENSVSSYSCHLLTSLICLMMTIYDGPCSSGLVLLVLPILSLRALSTSHAYCRIKSMLTTTKNGSEVTGNCRMDLGLITRSAQSAIRGTEQVHAPFLLFNIPPLSLSGSHPSRYQASSTDPLL